MCLPGGCVMCVHMQRPNLVLPAAPIVLMSTTLCMLRVYGLEGNPLALQQTLPMTTQGAGGPAVLHLLWWRP